MSDYKSKFCDPITTKDAVALLQRLNLNPEAPRPPSNHLEADVDAIVVGVATPTPLAPELTAIRSHRLSAAEAEAWQPDIILMETDDDTEEQAPLKNLNAVDRQYLTEDRDDRDRALKLLVEGLRTGRLFAEFLDDITAEPVPAAYWATDVGITTARQGYRLDPPGGRSAERHIQRFAIVSERDVCGLIGQAKSKSPGGRPPKHDWENIVFAIWAYAMDQGIPSTQAEFFRNVAASLGGREPTSETVLRQRTDRVFKEIQRIQRAKANPNADRP